MHCDGGWWELGSRDVVDDGDGEMVAGVPPCEDCDGIVGGLGVLADDDRVGGVDELTSAHR